MNRRIFAVAIAFILFICAGCGQEADHHDAPPLASGPIIVSSEPVVPNVDPNIIGRVTTVIRSSSGIELLVEEGRSRVASDPSLAAVTDTDTGEPRYVRARVLVDDFTAFRNDKEDEAVVMSSVAAGDMVAVWFSDDNVTDGGTLVVAHGQAVKVLTRSSGIDAMGISSLPRMVATSGNSSLAVITSVEHMGATQSTPLVELLAESYGATISASAGDSFSLTFSMPPERSPASYSVNPTGADPTPLEVAADSNRITIPSVEAERIYIFVDATFSQYHVQYAFAIRYVENSG